MDISELFSRMVFDTGHLLERAQQTDAARPGDREDAGSIHPPRNWRTILTNTLMDMLDLSPRSRDNH
jgi:hypothetical protein